MPTTVGIVDYGVGNHASVRYALLKLGYRCRVSADVDVLGGCDVLLLPGVGAFPPAMKALRVRGLDRFLVDSVGSGVPLVGVCLGMQLLAQFSEEGELTPGLGLLPGSVSALGGGKWHIGWNALDRPDSVDDEPIFQLSYGNSFYFNHSYVYRAAEKFVVGITWAGGTRFVSAVRRGPVVGVQFHPEKSQRAGQQLLRVIIESLKRA
jgi:glutamine amidotransferase